MRTNSWHQPQSFYFCLYTETYSAENLPKLWYEHLQVAVALHLLRQAGHLHDRLMSFVEQLFTELLLHSLSPGNQLGTAFKHIQAGSNRLRNTYGFVRREIFFFAILGSGSLLGSLNMQTGENLLREIKLHSSLLYYSSIVVVVVEIVTVLPAWSQL